MNYDEKRLAGTARSSNAEKGEEDQMEVTVRAMLERFVRMVDPSSLDESEKSYVVLWNESLITDTEIIEGVSQAVQGLMEAGYFSAEKLSPDMPWRRWINNFYMRLPGGGKENVIKKLEAMKNPAPQSIIQKERAILGAIKEVLNGLGVAQENWNKVGHEIMRDGRHVFVNARLILATYVRTLERGDCSVVDLYT